MKEEQEAERIIEMYESIGQFTDMPYVYAKQCALIHVNGIIEFINKTQYAYDTTELDKWQKVKSIIESK